MSQSQTDNGLLHMPSKHSVKDTADRLEALLNEKGLGVFARLNHQNNAKLVDLELQPTELIMFGNPKTGTPLMQSQRTMALDLPMKILIWEDQQGVTQVTYNDLKFLAKRHQITDSDTLINTVNEVIAGFAAQISQ